MFAKRGRAPPFAARKRRSAIRSIGSPVSTIQRSAGHAREPFACATARVRKTDGRTIRTPMRALSSSSAAEGPSCATDAGTITPVPPDARHAASSQSATSERSEWKNAHRSSPANANRFRVAPRSASTSPCEIETSGPFAPTTATTYAASSDSRGGSAGVGPSAHAPGSTNRTSLSPSASADAGRPTQTVQPVATSTRSMRSAFSFGSIGTQAAPASMIAMAATIASIERSRNSATCDPRRTPFAARTSASRTTSFSSSA